MIIDTHAHYDDTIFDDDRDATFAQCREVGVGAIVNAASDAASLDKVALLTKRYDFLYAAVGLHPECAMEMSDAHFARIGALCGAEKIVAVGEIGLDYHYETPPPDADEETLALANGWDHGGEPANWPPRSVQREVFLRQIDLAKERRLPVVVHSRDAAADTLALIKKTDVGATGCDLHCFGYSKESAREFLSLGCYLGIGGVSTFKNGRKLKEVVAYAPLDRLLLETDAPYLAPEPHRGKRNASFYLPLVVQAIAEIKGVSEEDVIATTTDNARRLFSKLSLQDT